MSNTSAILDRPFTENESPKSSKEPFSPKIQYQPQAGRFYLLDPQIKALESKSRVIALVGGTGAGKTYFGPHWIYDRARKKPGARFMAIGMQYERHVVNVMQKSLVDFFDSINVPYKLVTGKRLTLWNGSEILFGSAEKPASLEGPHLDGGVWMDEAGYMGRGAWEVAERRTGYHAERGAQILITTIPYLSNWLKTAIYDPWLRGDKSVTWLHVRSVDNPNYPIEEIKRRKATMRPEKFATFYLGEFSRPYGSIYPDPDDDEIIVDPFNIPEDWPCFAGHDWGWTAPTTGAWARWDPENDILYVVAEYQMRGATIGDHVGRWHAAGLTDIDQAWGDSANPEIWVEATNLGYEVDPVVKGEKSVAWGINVVYERLRSGRLKFFRGCHKLIDYRKRYVWDASPGDDEQLLEKPKKPQEAEHLMDALRYLCVGVVEAGLSKPHSIVDVKYRQLGVAA